MMATLTIGSRLFHARQFTGSGFFFNKLVDWDTLPDSKGMSNPRPQAHGSFGGGPDWSASAIITVEGFIRGSTRAEALALRDDLKRVRSLAGLSVMTLDDENGSRFRRVSVKRVKIGDIRNQRFVNFSIDVEAPDPLMYGPEVSVSTGVPVSGGGLLFPLGTNPLAYWDFGADGASGRVSITNVGTADVWPDLIATGGLGGFVATDVASGGSVRFDRPIPDGSSVRINQRTGMASIDGQSDVSGFVTVRDFFAVPAGATHQIQFAALGAVTGTPQFTVKLNPGYS